MTENPVALSLLFDCYGAVLTEKQRIIFTLYYHEDFSLAEISEQLRITRQGVRDALTRAKNILTQLEEQVGLVHRYTESRTAFVRITELAEELMSDNHRNQRSAEMDLKLAELRTIARGQAAGS